MKLTPQQAEEIAGEWLDAWNHHDLDGIMSHYSDDIIFYSPLIQRLMGLEDGCIKGKIALKEYFSKGLTTYPDLKFEAYHILTGVNSFVIVYKSIRDMLSTELFLVNENGLIKEVRAHYK